MFAVSGYGLEYHCQNSTETKKLASAINVASQRKANTLTFVEDIQLRITAGVTEERGKMTPTKKQILKNAVELYMAEQHSINFAFGDNLPEISELKEGGYWQRAKENLRVSKIPDVIILHV